jgi:hypothetical protein
MELTAVEALNFAYSELVKNADGKQKRRLDDALAGKIGGRGGYIVDDPDLPASLQGIEAPDWWDPYHDPWETAHRVRDVEIT